LEKAYWNNRYHKGSSGPGSFGAYRNWKWSVITTYVDPQDVIDVGCGDLLFWEGKNCTCYVGIDFSDYVIKKARALRPEWRFICRNASEFIEGLKAEVVLCIALLFHVMDKEEYLQILENLCRYSSKWIFINCWVKNPLRSRKQHQIYRALEEDFGVFFNHNFELVNVEVCFDQINAMYVFRKEGKMEN
jgi:ubiquinone/menaquinone biosynthesis C-methylase UbiE